MWYNMAQWEFVDWLLIWILETSSFQFEWDNGNLSKNAKKHGVQKHEMEEVFRSGMALPLGVQTSPVTIEQRFGLVGPTLKGRILQIAFTR
ncbi:MAG: BrnT family toxin [Bacteriovoracia bacterium]